MNEEVARKTVKDYIEENDIDRSALPYIDFFVEHLCESIKADDKKDEEELNEC